MEEPNCSGSKTIFGLMYTWNVTRNKAQNIETCNQKRDVIQLIIDGCPSNHQQNAQWVRPLLKIHRNCGATQQQHKTNHMHANEHVVVPLRFLWTLDIISTHRIQMGRQKNTHVVFGTTG